MTKLYFLLIALKTITCSCNVDSKKGFDNIRSETDIQHIGEMPSVANENSGIARADKKGFYWTHNDSGGKPELYRISRNGEMDSLMVVENAGNQDWEDITSDNAGNIYIGDFGNNSQSRKNLTIYKRSPSGNTARISFRYADQKDFPAKDPDFDCEAFFWFDGHLYLFTKSWAKKKQVTKLYKVPDQPGDYVLDPLETYKIKMQVTAADISPDKTKFALLTYGKLFIFGINNNTISFKRPLACLKTGRKQTEAVLFDDDQTILFTNEQGNIYSFRLAGLKI